MAFASSVSETEASAVGAVIGTSMDRRARNREAQRGVLASYHRVPACRAGDFVRAELEIIAPDDILCNNGIFTVPRTKAMLRREGAFLPAAVRTNSGLGKALFVKRNP